MYQLVKVSWVDSVQPQPRWQFIDDLDDPDVVNVMSVGWLVQETESTVVLAPNIGGVGLTNEQVSGIITIPKESIKKLEILS